SSGSGTRATSASGCARSPTTSGSGSSSRPERPTVRVPPGRPYHRGVAVDRSTSLELEADPRREVTGADARDDQPEVVVIPDVPRWTPDRVAWRVCTVLAIAAVSAAAVYAARYVWAMATTSLWTDELFTVDQYVRDGPLHAATDYRTANNHIL